ncbi:HAD-IA family hydrolase [Curtobacterium sp. MCBD17_035]|uniref:HAD family hydrolase n=1 Tax=Curtobacterium sp. MCBD17_035 TaxID=2175673 RepID=UPI000DA77619|nr:HAD-IA family hydrolase [Curtobacterium sp. MCBD17_035]WIB68919.1 HAD-IA family hydrolase [Curtobacterium sp. MCBD17_035]
MRNRTNRVVLWDFDGTLASREGLWSSTLEKALQPIAPGLGLAAADFPAELSVGFPWHSPDIVRVTQSAAAWWAAQHSVFLRAYTVAGVGREDAERAIAEIPIEYYRPSAWNLAEDAIPALARTAAVGYRNVILSNHAPELPNLVADLGLGPWIDATVTSAAVGAEKPNPRIFARAMEIAGAGEDVWMVGDDRIADIAGAEAVGLRAIQVGPRCTLTDAAWQIIQSTGAPLPGGSAPSQ